MRAIVGGYDIKKLYHAERCSENSFVNWNPQTIPERHEVAMTVGYFAAQRSTWQSMSLLPNDIIKICHKYT